MRPERALPLQLGLEVENAPAQLLVLARRAAHGEIVGPELPDPLGHAAGQALDSGECAEREGLEHRNAALGLDLRRNEQHVTQ